MKSPLCPNCQQAMSSVERGLGGVWSCIYCEGTWLTRAQAEALPEHFKSPEQGAAAEPGGANTVSLICPSCQSASFEARATGNCEICHCTTCSSLFFKRGVLAALSPEAFSANGEAPVAAVLAGIWGSALTLDTLPLAFALQARGEKNQAS